MREKTITIKPLKIVIIAILLVLLLASVTSATTYFFTKQLYGYRTEFTLPKLTSSSGNDYELLDDIYRILDTKLYRRCR